MCSGNNFTFESRNHMYNWDLLTKYESSTSGMMTFPIEETLVVITCSESNFIRYNS